MAAGPSRSVARSARSVPCPGPRQCRPADAGSGRRHLDLDHGMAMLLERSEDEGAPSATAVWSDPSRSGVQKPMCWTPSPRCSRNSLHWLVMPGTGSISSNARPVPSGALRRQCRGGLRAAHLTRHAPAPPIVPRPFPKGPLMTLPHPVPPVQHQRKWRCTALRLAGAIAVAPSAPHEPCTWRGR
jgi:hypothetical protein